MKNDYCRQFVYTTCISVNFHFIAKINIIPNSTSDEASTPTSILVNIDVIPPAVDPFLAEKYARLEVFWSQLCSLKR